ncbi:unnamed protein product [Orchesella dallaii]|uniref:Glucose-methanol-choline oxidoreductase N-terminal domain-containing protein n=1 Tax=Orchesella dallaii TaxID=48710 RepID=A0ABP1PLE6_9HEXA
MRPISPDPLVWTPAIVAGVLASISIYLNRWGAYMKFTDRVGTYWDYNGDQYDFIVGTSNLNFLIQSRGNPKDFDNWANITGDPSWSYENLLPYFRKTEDFHGIWENARTHGKGGPVRISLPEYTGMGDLYVKAAGELGYPRQDLNGYYTEGFDTIYYPLKDGKRFGVYGAFIEEATVNLEKRITTRQFAQVKRILIDADKRAYGVEYDWHGKTEVAYAAKEVIISAGAMISPQLLMLSGIGPKNHLEELGIQVLSDLPVGNNLQDHISAYLGPFFVNKPIAFSIERDITSVNIANFVVQGRGILTTSGTQAMGFFASKVAKARGQTDWPDIQIILAGVSIGKNFAADFARGFGVRKRTLERYWAHAVGKDSFLQIVSLGRPNAKGTIRLQNTDYQTQPLIDPNYLDNQEDLDILVEGIKKAVDIVEKTRTFGKVKGHFTEIPFPGCENIPFRSDKYWECYATRFSVTLHHIVGSCSMGRNDSKDAVVDTQLRVIGIDGLRVIDASVMPSVIVGNTNAPTIMVGEKGADMILQTYEAERLELIRLAEEQRIQREKEAAAIAAQQAAAQQAAAQQAAAQQAAAQQAAAQQAAAAAQGPIFPARPPPPPPPQEETDPDDYDYDQKRIRTDLESHNIKVEDVRKLNVSMQEELFLRSYHKSNKEFFEKMEKNFTRLVVDEDEDE